MTLCEEERKFRLSVCAYALLVNVAENSTSSELNLKQSVKMKIAHVYLTFASGPLKN